MEISLEKVCAIERGEVPDRFSRCEQQFVRWSYGRIDGFLNFSSFNPLIVQQTLQIFLFFLILKDSRARIVDPLFPGRKVSVENFSPVRINVIHHSALPGMILSGIQFGIQRKSLVDYAGRH